MRRGSNKEKENGEGHLAFPVFFCGYFEETAGKVRSECDRRFQWSAGR